MKRVLSLVLVFVMLFFVTVFAHPFSDVRGHWAEAEIEKAYQNGSVNGNPDGSFRPDDKVSRAEFLKMLTVLVCERAEVYISEAYADGTHWASKYYNFALENMYRPLDGDSEIDGIIPGKMSAEDFDLPIERWEMSFLVSSVMRNVCGIVGEETEKTYADREAASKSLPVTVTAAIDNAFFLGIMTGDENGCINPEKDGTRAEAVVIVNRVDSIIMRIIAEATSKQEEYDKKVEESLKTYENIPEGHPIVTVLMDNGKAFKIELYPEYAPQTVANFVALVQEGFYDGLTFHRIVENFVAQGGDPNGDGTGGSENNILGEFSQNGFDEHTLSHTKGVVSMARGQHSNSASSQFFICYTDAPFLDGSYAAFGKVISGFEVIEEFTKLELTQNSIGEMAVPVNPPVMKKVTVDLKK